MRRASSFSPNWSNVYGFLKDSSADWKPKAVLVFAILYLVWPIDLLPDFVPIINWLDDIGVTTLATAYLIYSANAFERKAEQKKLKDK